MIAFLLLLTVPALMWASQSVLLWRAGLPIQARLHSAALPPNLRRGNRIMTNVLIVLVLLVYPPLRGLSPISYYAGYFPPGQQRQFMHGAGVTMLYLALLYLAWMLSGNLVFEVRHDAGRLLRRMAMVPLAALLVALVEELLFRAVLLADLLRWLSPPAAIVVGAVVFAAAHYLRHVKRYWTFGGHLSLGVLFGVAFVCTGALWLSVGLHAGGTLLLLGARRVVRHTGPAWLVGESIFPYAGLIGMAAVWLMTWNMYAIYGRR